MSCCTIAISVAPPALREGLGAEQAMGAGSAAARGYRGCRWPVQFDRRWPWHEPMVGDLNPFDAISCPASCGMCPGRWVRLSALDKLVDVLGAAARQRTDACPDARVGAPAQIPLWVACSLGWIAGGSAQPKDQAFLSGVCLRLPALVLGGLHPMRRGFP